MDANIPDSYEILDPNWIATMLGIVFTLFIFLLGIPALVFQTFLPEDIRGIYVRTEFHKKQKVLFKRFKVAVVVCLLIFGNHAIVYIIKRWGDIICNDKDWLFDIYYLAALAFFVAFSLYTYSYFHKSVFGGTNIRELVVKDVISNAKICYDSNGKFDKRSIEDLSELGRSYTSGVNKSIYFKEQYGLVEYILNHAVYVYDGGKLTDLLEETILPYIDGSVGHNNHCNEVLDICNAVKKKYSGDDDVSSGLNDYDANAIIKILYIIGEHAVEKNMFDVVMQVFYILRDGDAVHDKVFNLCKQACERKDFAILTSEITYLESCISKGKMDDITKTNLICYLSWLWDDNGKTKKYALSLIARLKGKLNMEDFVEAENELYLRAKFDDSQMIANFKTYVIDNRLL